MVFGGQDLSTHSSGAYTGEIAGPMLAKLGCTYVTVGHSERRQYHGENDATRRGQGEGRVRQRTDPDHLRGGVRGRSATSSGTSSTCVDSLDLLSR